MKRRSNVSTIGCGSNSMKPDSKSQRIAIASDRQVDATAVPLDFAELMQAEDDIADFLINKTSLGLDVHEFEALLGTLDHIQNSVGGWNGGASTGAPGANSGRSGGEQTFQSIHSRHQFFHIALGWNFIIVHEEFHHRIEADGFAFFSRHDGPPVGWDEVNRGVINSWQSNG
ncbi:MAG: hypothetical protein MUC57_05995 [Desulfobacterales bacterium]|nr:hypothetical protein [Desulfobacterales bacterium]